MKTKMLYRNLSLVRERRCFDQTLVPEGTGTALLLGDNTDRRTEQAAEKLARAGIVLVLAGNLGWKEARRLCIQNEGCCSLQQFHFPEQNLGENARAAVWFYLSLQAEPGSAEELIALYNGLLSLMRTGEKEKKLEAFLGKQETAALLQAVHAVQTCPDDPDRSSIIKKRCGAVDFPALRTAFLKNWK